MGNVFAVPPAEMLRKPIGGGWKINVHHPLNRGLVAWFLMNEGAGSRLFNLCGYNNANILGGTWDVDKRGKVLTFNGSSDYSQLDGGAILIEPPITVSAWVKMSTNGDMTVFDISDTDSNSYAYELMMGDSFGDTVLWVARAASSNYAQSATSYTVGKWHHIAGIERANNDRSAFIDGGNEGTNGISRVPINLDTTAIGVRKRTSLSQYFNGIIDNILVYNRILSASEIYQLYQYPYGTTSNPRLI